MESKYIGQVFEGRWKVIALHKEKFTLENIYNERKIELFRTVFMKVVKGKTTISKIICCRVNRNHAVRTLKVVSQVRQRQFAYSKKMQRGEL